MKELIKKHIKLKHDLSRISTSKSFFSRVAIGWRSTGEAVFEKRESYYYKCKEAVLNAGDTFLGVKIAVK